MSLVNVAWIEETNLTSIIALRLLVEKQLTLSYLKKKWSLNEIFQNLILRSDLYKAYKRIITLFKGLHLLVPSNA